MFHKKKKFTVIQIFIEINDIYSQYFLDHWFIMENSTDYCDI